jgi:hypothetical protein
MRNSIIAAVAVISMCSIATIFSAHASWSGPEGSGSVSTIIDEQESFPLCSFKFERLLPINPDDVVLIKICA